MNARTLQKAILAWQILICLGIEPILAFITIFYNAPRLKCQAGK